MAEELLDHEQRGAVDSALEPTRVLVADDAPNIRLGVSRMLEKWGYEVHSAADGDEAWAILEKEPIQLVISDPDIGQPMNLNLTHQKTIPLVRIFLNFPSDLLFPFWSFR